MLILIFHHFKDYAAAVIIVGFCVILVSSFEIQNCNRIYSIFGAFHPSKNYIFFHLQATLWYTDKLILNFGKPLHNIAEEFQTSILKGDASWSSLDVRLVWSRFSPGSSEYGNPVDLLISNGIN